MSWSEQEVSRVRASVEDIKNSYSLISRFYAIFEGLFEKREGVDVLHFKNRKIIQKLTYSKTSVEIDCELIKPSVMKR